MYKRLSPVYGKQKWSVLMMKKRWSNHLSISSFINPQFCSKQSQLANNVWFLLLYNVSRFQIHSIPFLNPTKKRSETIGFFLDSLLKWIHIVLSIIQIEITFITSQRVKSLSRLIPCEWPTPEAVIVKEVINTFRFLGFFQEIVRAAESLKLIVVQHNYTRDAMTATGLTIRSPSKKVWQSLVFYGETVCI